MPASKIIYSGSSRSIQPVLLVMWVGAELAVALLIAHREPDFWQRLTLLDVLGMVGLLMLMLAGGMNVVVSRTAKSGWSRQRMLDFAKRAAEEIINIITNVDAQIDAIGLDLNDRTSIKHRCATAMSNTARLTKTVNYIDEVVHLREARVQSRSQWTLIRLDELAQVVVKSFEKRFAARNQSLRIGNVQPCNVRGDLLQLNRMISVLLENALIHNDASASVTVDAGNRSFLEAFVSISDEGAGISQIDLGAIGVPFFRADKARSIQQGGCGLGLTVASEIVRHHSGLLSVASAVGAGTKFTVLLPRHSF